MKHGTTFALAALLVLLASPAFGQADADDTNRPGSCRPGFYLGLDVGGAAYRLDDSVEDRFTAQGIELSNNANGIGIAVGYSWRNELALELQLFVAPVSSEGKDVEAGLAQFDLAVRAPLLPRRNVSPYLEGHVGGVALGFSGDAIEDQGVYGGSTGLGTGVEVHFARHWAVDLGYQFTLVDYRRASIDVAGSTSEIDIEGGGQIHRLVLRTVFSF